MSDDALRHPHVRPIEVHPGVEDGQYVVIDPTGLAAGAITMSQQGVFILMHCDGRHRLEEIRNAFAAQFGQMLPVERIRELVHQLELAHYLHGEGFNQYFDGLVEEYRAAPARLSHEAEAYGAEDGELDVMLARLLDSGGVEFSHADGRRPVGLIAPHLDYARGWACYADAYSALRVGDRPERVVILGTNHFGRGTGPVATRKRFQTPLGTTATDATFLAALQDRCGVDLCEHEFDHLREHSVELQVMLLQKLLGAENFEMVPVLCHDPCGPNGTASYDGQGADLKVFAEALGEIIRADGKRTLIVAGADLSHIGAQFGDERELDSDFRGEVEQSDRQVLSHLCSEGAEQFRAAIRRIENRTRICSAGCIYALLTALPGAEMNLLRYDQAVDVESGTGVTCCAAVLWGS